LPEPLTGCNRLTHRQNVRHTKALRAAGLIVSARAGKAVRHSATPLGSRLLDSGRAGQPR